MTIAPLGPAPSGPPAPPRPDMAAALPPADPPKDPAEPAPVPQPAPAMLVQSLWQTPQPAAVPPPDRVLEPYGILMLPSDRPHPG